MKYIFFLSLSLLFYTNLKAQNRVFDNTEMVNFGNLDLLTVVSDNKWTTERTDKPGKFSNYGEATFLNGNAQLELNSEPQKWINGYVKHYATENNISHLYPVGDGNSRRFLSTDNEIAGESIAVAWVKGNPNQVADLTLPETGIHNTNHLSDLDGILSDYYWDWISTYSEGEVKVSLKIPEYPDNPDIRLAGWRNDRWCNLSGNNGSSDGIITGNVPPNFTALAIGKASSSTKTISDNTLINGRYNPIVEKSIDSSSYTFFEVFPNPASTNGITLNYKINYFGAANILLYDMLGKLVYEESIMINSDTNTNIVNTSGLSKGIYTLLMNDADNAPLMKPKKIVIQN